MGLARLLRLRGSAGSSNEKGGRWYFGDGVGDAAQLRTRGDWAPFSFAYRGRAIRYDLRPFSSLNGLLSRTRRFDQRYGPSKMVEDRANPVAIEYLLRNEYGRRFYGDGAPRWWEGRNATPSSTAEQAAHQRDLLVNALRRDRGAEAIALAGKLTTCSSRCSCLSGACPLCGRALQRMGVHATRNLYDGHGGEMLAVNVVMRERMDRSRRSDRRRYIR